MQMFLCFVFVCVVFFFPPKKHPQKLAYYEETKVLSTNLLTKAQSTVQNSINYCKPSQTLVFQLLVFCLFLSHNDGKSCCQLWLFTEWPKIPTFLSLPPFHPALLPVSTTPMQKLLSLLASIWSFASDLPLLLYPTSIFSFIFCILISLRSSHLS